jgi:hypothetical protein
MLRDISMAFEGRRRRTNFIKGKHLTSHLSTVIHRNSHSVVYL